MQIGVIASGSNGNSCLIEDKDTSILIDAGKSAKEIEARLNRMGKSLENLNGIVLTHSHIDHYIGIGPIARKYNIPVYVTKETYMETADKLGAIHVKNFNLNSNFKINNLKIQPIATSHDVSSCGFVINKFGFFTDTGIVTKQMGDALPHLKGILLESNHDIDMLINGPYPAFLKQRILSDNGHLSNIHASSYIQDKAKDLNFVLLAHLSANNNTIEKAKQTFEMIVKKKINYSVLSRDKESGIWEL
jgi:phosphoribosyl 1,2-cyclic phosphodiesterase